jgi:serine/threonine protein kinase
MNYKYQINSKHQAFTNFLLDIKSYFFENTQTIHKARNELKIINYNGLDSVVKSFKTPHLLNRVVYTFFRDSKAKKSYEYSLRIGDFTPQPIGYIEFFENFLLKESYFISEQFKYDFTIREPLLDANFENREEIFKAFGRFTYELHKANILHQDYSPGNILIKKENGIFLFKIVDINRMEFRKLNLNERLKNFSKLWASEEALTIMLKEYAQVSKEDEKQCVSAGLAYNTKHKNKINMKKRLKGIEVVD